MTPKHRGQLSRCSLNIEHCSTQRSGRDNANLHGPCVVAHCQAVVIAFTGGGSVQHHSHIKTEDLLVLDHTHVISRPQLVVELLIVILTDSPGQLSLRQSPAAVPAPQCTP